MKTPPQQHIATVVALIGLAILAYGVHLIYHPAGLITAGLIVAGGAFLFAYDRDREDRIPR